MFAHTEYVLYEPESSFQVGLSGPLVTVSNAVAHIIPTIWETETSRKKQKRLKGSRK